MSLAILFHLLCAQHVSDINISVIRSLRLCCWITTSVVLFSVRCVNVIQVLLSAKPVWYYLLLCVQWKTPDDGQRNCPKHVEFYSKKIWEISASSWCYYTTMHGHLNVKFVFFVFIWTIWLSTVQSVEFRQYKNLGVKIYFNFFTWDENSPAVIAGGAASRFASIFTIVIYMLDRKWLLGKLL